jgi:GntR family transcriptional regulator, phosphonate transport system regulatory protein
MENLNHNGGVSLWRQISEALAADIESGHFAANERLPSSEELGKRFSVNRHTIRRAIANLETEGLLRMERGRGVYAVVNPLEFRLGPRQWFEQNLFESNRLPSRTILSSVEMKATTDIAKPLAIRDNAPVLFVTILGEADGIPINLGYHYFPCQRLPGITEAFAALGAAPSGTFSFNAILASVGVSDWRRKSVHIRARQPTRVESLRLKISASDPLLVTRVISVDEKETPLVYAQTCYASSRAELVVDL